MNDQQASEEAAENRQCDRSSVVRQRETKFRKRYRGKKEGKPREAITGSSALYLLGE